MKFMAQSADTRGACPWRHLLAKTLFITLVLAFPLLYAGKLAGDAEIHLVYGRNAALGRFFQFNPGENSPGETSPGYMMAVAASYVLFDESVVPLVMKVLNVLGWYLFVGLLWLILKRLLKDGRAAGAALAMAAFMPGSVYSATTGMENIYFAILVLWWLHLCLRWGILDRPEDLSYGKSMTLGTLLGLASWLRPEAVVVFGAWLLFLALMSFRRGLKTGRAIGQVFMQAACFSLMGTVLVAFHRLNTGYCLPSSGVSRTLFTMTGGLKDASTMFNPHFAIRLLMYWPFTLLWLIGMWTLVFTRKKSTAGLFFNYIFLALFMFYSLFLTVTQISRYVILAMACMSVGAGFGVAVMLEDVRRKKRFLSVAMAMLLVSLGLVYAAEAVWRYRLPPPTTALDDLRGGMSELGFAMKAPAIRGEASEFLEDLLRSGSKKPAVVACSEVQIRHWLDDRFRIVSLDGIIDPTFNKYVTGGHADYVGYFRDRGVDYLLNTNDRADADGWTLSGLDRLRDGEADLHRGMRFIRLGRFYRVEDLERPSP